jgi:hypothetical protein
MIRTFALCLLLPTLGSAAPGLKEKPLYFSTQVGATFEFENKVNNRIHQETLTIDDVKKKDGAWIIRYSHSEMGVKLTTLTIRLSELEMVLLSNSVEKFEPPHALLKVTAKVGDTWKALGDNGTELIYKAMGEEEVEVPAGKFKALRVDTTFKFKGGDEGISSTWYAPQLGRIKAVLKTGRLEHISVLKAFTEGKK